MTTANANSPTTKTWSGPNRTGRTQVNRLDAVGRRILTVSRVEKPTPRYRRVYLTGEALAGGFPYVHLAPTDHVKVVFPQPGERHVALPERGPNGWTTPSGRKPIIRDYTVRAWLPETRELVLEFVIHGDGPASGWAENAKPGDELGVMGPRGNIVFPENYAYYLLAGDEAAIPTLARFAEELPEGASARILVEVADAAERQELRARPGIELDWVLRSEAGPSGLEEALRAAEMPAGDDWFVFAAGEAGAMKRVRDYFRLELGLPRERVVIDGLWMRGVPELDHHAIDLNAD